jgi:S-adenosylmethionine synthetase
MLEIIEYKSQGHPDTLTDLVVEDCASFLDSYYKKQYGKILHYNVDKALFSAGDCDIHYGGGIIKAIPNFILGGQATNLDNQLRNNLVDEISVEIRTGTTIKNLVDIATEKDILANDTSFGVGYYPHSPAEHTVFAIQEELDQMIEEQVIPIGELYKIMYTVKTISISAPLYAQRVYNRKEYAEYKKQIESRLSDYGKIIFNPDFENGFPYLTLCGSSVECGDDGQVGRGNRYNGLITPCRPMTIEAYHGKNNKNHVGKLYQKLAFEKAKESYEKTGQYTEVILVSKIGRPIDEYETYITTK